MSEQDHGAGRPSPAGSQREIPLFPLHVVLFPGMPLPLQIFEARYHAMIQECLAGDRIFGVSLVTRGLEVGGYADVSPVGTSAYIDRVEQLPNGRLAVVTRGIQRFRIVERLPDNPYPRAVVTMLGEGDSESVDQSLVRQIQDLLLEYLRQVARRAGQDWGDLSMPDDPVVLGYVVGAVLPCSLGRKQELLQASTLEERLSQEAPMLEKELIATEERGPVIEMERQTVEGRRVLRVRLYTPEADPNPN